MDAETKDTFKPIGVGAKQAVRLAGSTEMSVDLAVHGVLCDSMYLNERSEQIGTRHLVHSHERRIREAYSNLKKIIDRIDAQKAKVA